MGRKVRWWPVGSGQHAVPASRIPVAVTTTALVLLAAIPVTVTACVAAKNAAPGYPGSESIHSFTRAPAGWRTTFQDTFSGPAGSGVDSNWTYDTGTQYHGASCPANWGTGEVESASRSNANVYEDGHGHLIINAVRSGRRWASGRIETASRTFAAPPRGEMQVIASIEQPSPSHGLGYWPAFWMLGAGFRVSGAGTSGDMACSKWPSVGEIDILEDVNALSQHSATVHCGINPGGPCREPVGLSSGLRPCQGCQTGYNTYSVIINRTSAGHESITWYLNGKAYHTVTERQVGVRIWKAAVDHGFFLILDVAIGGGYRNHVCGCTTPAASTSTAAAMRVRYIAVYVRQAV
jgi:beta-glucanase (GH16 family)